MVWDHNMTLARGAQAAQSCAMILEWCCMSPEARVPRAQTCDEAWRVWDTTV